MSWYIGRGLIFIPWAMDVQNLLQKKISKQKEILNYTDSSFPFCRILAVEFAWCVPLSCLVQPAKDVVYLTLPSTYTNIQLSLPRICTYMHDTYPCSLKILFSFPFLVCIRCISCIVLHAHIPAAKILLQSNGIIQSWLSSFFLRESSHILTKPNRCGQIY